MDIKQRNHDQSHVLFTFPWHHSVTNVCRDVVSCLVKLCVVKLQPKLTAPRRLDMGIKQNKTKNAWLT